MKDFFSTEIAHRDVLIVGKGKSMEKAKKVTNMLKIGLNHTHYVDISHQVDWNSQNYSHKFVLTPYYPLYKHRPYDKLAPNLPNVYCYNLYCQPEMIGISPVIEGDGFSIHYVIKILALKNVKNIYLCGIDGGTEYHSTFSFLKPNPQGYDRQFKHIDKLKNEHNLTIQNL